MLRIRQQAEDILASLSVVETDWIDPHGAAVLALLETIPERPSYGVDDIIALLKEDFDTGVTLIRLILGLSADEFRTVVRNVLPGGTWGKTRLQREPAVVASVLDRLGVPSRLQALVNTPVGWRDILIERLRGGRGSAIKGQTRGRGLEDFVEELVKRTIGEGRYDKRCRFVGATGTSSEKTDFAIPSKDDASILIEVKAYGATGSKQTDILGDVARIVDEKRPDTDLLIFTDGITWRDRASDLRKLVDMQNRGAITRIYTMSMAEQLEADLLELKREHAL